MLTWNKPEVSLEVKYYKVIRISLIIALCFVTALLLAIPQATGKKEVVLNQPDVEIQNVEIPQTQQFDRPPVPSRPTIPVPSEDEDLAENITISETTFEEFAAMSSPPPPPAPEEPTRIKFIPYDEPPVIIGGIESLRRNIIYPEIAKEAGIEGTVIVQAFINKNGIVEDVVVVKGVPKTGLDEAAVEAIKKTRFKPAKQRDTNVGVWYSIPITFKLKSS